MNWQKYDRWAFIFDSLERFLEKWSGFGELRRKYISSLKGKILEIGVGSGANLRYYSDKAEVVGIEPSPKMLARARKKNRSAETARCKIRTRPRGRNKLL